MTHAAETHLADTNLEEFWDCASREALQRTTDLARRAFKAPVAAITSVLGDRQITRCVSTADADAAALRLSGLLCREVVETGRSLILRDIPPDERHAKILREVPAAAYIGVPVRLSCGLDIGALCVLDAEPHPWDDGDLELLVELAAFLTSQIELKLEILQREKAERALCATEAKLVAVANRIPGLVFERRKMADGQARYTFFGSDKTRLPAGQRLMNARGVDLDFIHPGDRELVRTALARSNWEETDLDLTFRVQDGDDIHWLRSQAIVRREADGTICWDGLCFDISDLVAARDAAEAARIAKDALLVNVNHELRAPLQAIIGFTEFLKTETRPHLIAAHARNIQLAGDSLLAIVNQLLTNAGSADQMGTSIVAFDLRTFGESCLSMVGPAAVEKHLKTRLEIDDDLPATLTLDAQKLQQALINLLNNAVKFTVEGSIILRIARAAKGVRFSVVDTGIGIPDEKRSLLFRRFSRLAPDDETAKGSGLGLSITKTLVEQMDGEIGVERHVDHGTTFWFVVPIKAAVSAPLSSDPPKISRPGGAPLASASTGARILLADDLDLNRKLIADMLSIDGHVVDCVEDGLQAVEAATKRSYDLILMDMIMPRMDGVAATRAIRALPAPLCKVPIVALTAHSFPEQLDSCLAAGMDATLVKPMSMEALSAAVNDWTRGRKAA